MAELLLKAVGVTHADSTKDRRGCYKRGMFVVAMPDDHPWGQEERLPKFCVIKIPLISIAQVLKYVATWDTSPTVRLQRRRWRIRWVDLPQAAQDILQNTGMLTIKATAAYTGPFDYTWAQVKQYFRNDETGLDESADLV